jgi:MoxR-like ATPase
LEEVDNMTKKETLFKLFDKAKEREKSIILIGNYGIGKSQIIYEYAEQKAKQLNKELVIWHTLTEEQKKELIENKEKLKKSFIIVDIKLQSIGDISKITGIPLIVNGNSEHKIIWELPLFLKVLSQEESDGILFLDEINMASPSLQSTVFEIILQKKIGEWKLNNNILVIGAGNTLDVNISANPIPKPLINRCVFIKFNGFDLEDWLRWAISKQLDERVISFVKMFKELYKDSEEELETSTRPRSYKLLSDLIKNENDIDYIELIAFGTLHKSTATEFVNFIKLFDKLDFKKYINEPILFDNEETQVKYAIITLLARNVNQIDIKSLVNFITHISRNEPEFTMLFLMLIKNKPKVIDKILLSLPKDIIDRFASILTF